MTSVRQGLALAARRSRVLIEVLRERVEAQLVARLANCPLGPEGGR